MNVRKISVFLLLAVICLPQIPVKSADITSGQKYQKRVVQTMSKGTLALDGQRALTDEEKMQLEKSAEEKSSYEVLVPKTDAKYEVTLAYSDGSYSYVGKADTYDKAVEVAKDAKSSLASDSIIPTVIDSNGNVIYATEAIGRVYKLYSDHDNNGRDVLSYVYPTSSLRGAYTYINDGYINEAPLIQNNENEAKVLVNGYEGWLNKNINRDVTGSGHPSRDLLIEPINQLPNPNYYTVSKGLLIHFISTSWAKVGVGTSRTIGVAPSYLKEGQRYYSYDGNYFYDGSQSISKGLGTLTTDLQNGNHNNAVNSNSPYYNYYNYLPFRTKTNYTAAELDSYINKIAVQTSKLRGLGQAFKDAESTYGVNALLALSIAINESSGDSGPGTSKLAMTKNNLFGLNATDNNTTQNASYYNTPADSVMEFAKNYISRGYSDTANWTDYGGFLGNKKLGANVQYASDPFWSEKAVSYAMDAESYLSSGNIANMKDYNYYQLIRYTGTNLVTTSAGTPLYNILSSVNPGSGSFIGAVAAISTARTTNVGGISCFEINPERTTPNTLGRFNGLYDWNTKGYVNTSNIELINKGKSGFKDEDIDLDGDIDMIDLATIGQSYNSKSGQSKWNNRNDINGDGIVDIYDIVRIALKL